MKKIFTLLVFMSALALNAQSIRILNGTTPLNDGDTVIVPLAGIDGEINTYLGYQNMTDDDLSFRVRKEQLVINEGQLDWLPRNPRSWSREDIDRMVRSIEKDPDFAEDRPVLAVPGDGGVYVVFAHNLLTRASKEKGTKRLPTGPITETAIS